MPSSFALGALGPVNGFPPMQVVRTAPASLAASTSAAVAVAFPAAFADSNYTVLVAVEDDSVATVGLGVTFVSVESLTENGFTAIITNTDSAATHDYILHIVAIYNGQPAPVPEDLTDLWTTLGVQPAGWWSSRRNQTLDGANLAAWLDVRGAGFGGPAIAPGAGPAVVAGVPTFANAASDYMRVTPAAKFDLSAGGTLVVVAAPTGGTLDAVLVSISESTLTRVLAVGAGASGAVADLGGAVRGAATLAYVQSVVAPSATIRLIIFSKGPTTSALLNVPAKPQVAGTSDAAAGGPLGLAFGDYYKSLTAGQGAFGQGGLYEVGWFPGVQFSTAQIAATNAWAVASVHVVDA
jgi:hypothetical protein